jgi:hypothetical protein
MRTMPLRLVSADNSITQIDDRCSCGLAGAQEYDTRYIICLGIWLILGAESSAV